MSSVITAATIGLNTLRHTRMKSQRQTRGLWTKSVPLIAKSPGIHRSLTPTGYSQSNSIIQSIIRFSTPNYSGMYKIFNVDFLPYQFNPEKFYKSQGNGLMQQDTYDRFVHRQASLSRSFHYSHTPRCFGCRGYGQSRLACMNHR